MEHQLYREIVAVLRRIGKWRRRRNEGFTDEEIVQTWFWGVLHDRPVSWSCERRNWPLRERSRARPPNRTMSRRLRSAEVRRCWIRSKPTCSVRSSCACCG